MGGLEKIRMEDRNPAQARCPTRCQGAGQMLRPRGRNIHSPFSRLNAQLRICLQQGDVGGSRYPV